MTEKRSKEQNFFLHHSTTSRLNINDKTTDNIVDRDELQDQYINAIIDGMDLKDLIALAYDHLDENLDKYSVGELITEVEEYYPELLENNQCA